MRRTRLNILPPMGKLTSMNKVAINDAEPVAHPSPEAANGYALVSVNGQSVPAVSVAATVVDANIGKESRTQRVRRLQDEARELANEQIREFESVLMEAARMADEIAEGGDIYPIGVREICRRMGEELPRNLQTLQAIIKKI